MKTQNIESKVSCEAEQVGTISEIPLSEINLDRETQIRVAASEETVQRYFEVMENEAGRDKFPPVLLFQDEDGKFWLADGHHRITAAQRRNFTTIRAIVRPGTKADAIWEAAKANGRNGLQLGRADICRAVEMILTVFPDRSNRAIAEVLGCDEKTVRKYRPSASGADLSAPEKRTGKDGKSYPTLQKDRKISIASTPKTTTVTKTAIAPTEDSVTANVSKPCPQPVDLPLETPSPTVDRSETPLRKIYSHYDDEKLAKDLLDAFSPWCVSSLPFAIFEELCKDEKQRENIENMMNNFLNRYIVRKEDPQYKPFLTDLFDRMYGDPELVDKIMKFIEKEERENCSL